MSTRWSDGCIPRTRSVMLCSSWRLWTALVRYSIDEEAARKHATPVHHSVCLRPFVWQDASATSTSATARAEAQNLPLCTSLALSSCSRGCSCWETWHTRLMIASRLAGADRSWIPIASEPQSLRSVATTTSASPPCASALSTRSLASSIHGSCCKLLGRCLSIALLQRCALLFFSPTISLSLATCTCKKKKNV